MTGLLVAGNVQDWRVLNSGIWHYRLFLVIELYCCSMAVKMMIAYNYSAILRSRADSLSSHVILHQWLAFL